MCPDVDKEVVPAVVAPAAHLADKGLGLGEVLLAVSLHAVGVAHRHPTEVAPVHSLPSCSALGHPGTTLRETAQQRRVAYKRDRDTNTSWYVRIHQHLRHTRAHLLKSGRSLH